MDQNGYYQPTIDSANKEFAKVYMREDEDFLVLDVAPEYFPGVDLCAAMFVSRTIVLDCTRQYVRQSFQNRAKVRTPDGWQWLSIPLVAHQHGRSIEEVVIDEGKDWRKVHLQSLRYNYRSTPFYDFIEPRIEDVLSGKDGSLSALMVDSTLLTIELLGLAAEVKVRKQGMPVDFERDPERISIERLTRPGGSDIAVGIPGITYRQNFEGFVRGLSGLDLIFNYGPESLSIISEYAEMKRL
ncbi:MAG: hypothetical protein HKN43_10100 [Rhodothermales bacterium]|nr:hypothetical protein [Rhodothermales bacterium]